MATKILFVDDEPEVEGMIKLKYRREIRKGVYEFLFAQNGVEALSQLEQHEDINIIVSDINMPKMDGLTLLGHVTKMDRILKPIIISAYGDMDNIRTAMNRGAYDFLTKPIDFDDLTTTLEKTQNTVDELLNNIYALEEAEESLRDSNALNKAIINNAGETIISVSENGNIEKINPAVKNMFGYSPEELLGKNIETIIPESFFAVNNSNNSNEIETYGVKKDNTKFEVELSVSEFSVKGQKMYNGMIRDISIRKNAEKLLREYNETLEKDVKKRTEELLKLNQEKNEILGIAAHDLKNPLSNIKMLAKIILEDTEIQREEVEEFTNDILTASERMFELIKNLLDVNKIEQGRIDLAPENFDLAETVKNEIKSFYEAAHNKNIELIFDDIEEELPFVYADQGKALQIIDNLVSNAVKYSPYNKRVWIGLYQTEDKVCFYVKDEGPGISEEDQKKLFGKFARLTAQPTGGEHSTGLGLSIVKKLTELMNGDVWCESSLGEGAKFILSLPKAEQTDG